MKKFFNWKVLLIAAVVASLGFSALNKIAVDQIRFTTSPSYGTPPDSSILYKGADGIVRRTNISSEASAGYLVYTALLTQTGTDAPVATVLQNTLGESITSGFEANGRYSLSNSGAGIEFEVSKTVCFITNNNSINDVYIYANRISVTQIEIYSQEANGDGTFTGANGYLNGVSIEIRVYP